MTEFETQVLDWLRLLTQATLSAAWAVSFCAGLMLWRLIVLAKNQRRFWCAAAVLVAPGFASAQGWQADPIVEYVQSTCAQAPSLAFRVSFHHDDGSNTYIDFNWAADGEGEYLVESHGPTGVMTIDQVLCQAYANGTNPAAPADASVLGVLSLALCGIEDNRPDLRNALTDIWNSCTIRTGATIGLDLGGGGCTTCAFQDADGDGVADAFDPEPNNPDVCGDWDGDGDDDCAGDPSLGCEGDADCDGVPDEYDPDDADAETCGDWNEDGVDDCDPSAGDPCEGVCDVGAPCEWRDDCGGAFSPVGCWVCGCVDDPETEEDECDRVVDSYSCVDCDLDVDGLMTRVAASFEAIGLPLTRVLPEISNWSYTITIPIVNPATGQIVNQSVILARHDLAGLGAAGDVLNGYRVVFRNFLAVVFALLLVFRALRTLNYGG